MDYTQHINNYIELEISTLKNLCIDSVNRLINVLDEARKRDATIYIMGNGGSASTASHFVNDFNKGVSEHLEQKFRFVCLNDNTATVLAIANDIGYDSIFEFQLNGKLEAGDVVIGISGSGNSVNVLRAIKYAKTIGATTVGLTGYDGGKLMKEADLSVHVPAMSMQITEDVHMILDHMMMAVFCKVLCGIEHLRG